jgi:hypothetical protein
MSESFAVVFTCVTVDFVPSIRYATALTPNSATTATTAMMTFFLPPFLLFDGVAVDVAASVWAPCVATSRPDGSGWVGNWVVRFGAAAADAVTELKVPGPSPKGLSGRVGFGTTILPVPSVNPSIVASRAPRATTVFGSSRVITTATSPNRFCT